MLETHQQRVTERREETQKAPCKLVLADPHPVVRMNFGATIHLCAIKREKKDRGFNKAAFNDLVNKVRCKNLHFFTVSDDGRSI